MGSPMVFHTAPPHPASNARMICSPQFVGGADASQKGLGDRMPAKFVERSGIRHPEGLRDCDTGTLSFRNGIHHFAASVHAVAAGEIFRTVPASDECPMRRLPNSWDNHVAKQVKI